MRRSPTFVVERKRSFAKVPPPAPRTHARRNSFLVADTESEEVETSLTFAQEAPEISQPAPRILPNLLAVDPLEEKLRSVKTRGRKPKPPTEARQAKAKAAELARFKEPADESSIPPPPKNHLPPRSASAGQRAIYLRESAGSVACAI